MKDEMNKKLLIVLLLPLMLLPMVSFGYAHWTDTVTKRYKLRPGTVEIHIIQWHVDYTTSYDANCNGEILGDELQIMPVYDDHDPPEVIGVNILADPIFPCWELEFKMLIHVKGRLAVRFEEPKIVMAGPYPDNPCFAPIDPNDPYYVEYDYVNQEFPGIDWFDYYCSMWKHNDALYGDECDLTSHPDGCPCYDKSHYDVLANPTEFRYKPCECLMIKQYMHLKQASPTMPQDRLQEFLSCHWLRIDFEIEAINEVGMPWGSVGEEYPSNWVPYVPEP
jgi:hypothetical protein